MEISTLVFEELWIDVLEKKQGEFLYKLYGLLEEYALPEKREGDHFGYSLSIEN